MGYNATCDAKKYCRNNQSSRLQRNDDSNNVLVFSLMCPLHKIADIHISVYVGSYWRWTWGSYVINATNALLSFSGGNGTTPLILDLNHDSVRTLGTEAGVQYDITGAGLRTSVGWSALKTAS